MTHLLPDSLIDEVHGLTLACINGEAAAEDINRLDTLLLNNEAARRVYAHAIRDSFNLRRWAAATQLNAGEASAECEPDATSLLLSLADADLIAGIALDDVAGNASGEVSPATAAPLPTFVYNTVGYFSSGWPVAYLVATVILGVGMFVASLIHVSQPAGIATQSVPLPKLDSFVGQITGMVDCQWSEEGRVNRSDAPPETRSLVSLGDKFELASGLLEVTYDTGARALLQGPVTYDVETNGGFLSFGKLTGKLERQGASSQLSVVSQSKIEDSRSTLPSDLKSQIPNPFVIRTPTATVTDLGTEFGVEVDSQGHTTSQVFRGAVRLDVASTDGKATGASRILRANESAEVDGRMILDKPSMVRSQFPRMLKHRTLPLVALYRFDGNAKDASGNDHHVSPKNMRDITFVEGVAGQAAQFDANAKSYIDLPVDASPSVMPRLTWGAWVRPRTVGPRPAEIITNDSMGYGRTMTINDRVGVDGQTTGAFRFAAFLGDQDPDRGIFPSSGPLPTPNEWTFVAIVYDDSSHRVCLFVEDKSLHGNRGGLVEDRTIGVQFGPCHPFIRVGRHADWEFDCADAFDGDIDNLFIFCEVLNARELERVRKDGCVGIVAIAQGED